ncbi:MAG: hypothetical protein COX19_11635 [Desulfobacterales bacterium CG23_combo_of_CG06-09_8_20_14_all_51_8]|nr:MAG: hypothetical protein COX19_11635 [Desulfobacterales bacterium CG23_combo_of_CG06-09_8_20_14_all_51_8]
MTVLRNKFDFEIGYLVKSPCRECANRKDLPECSDTCGIIDKIQVILSKGVSCTGKHAASGI